jgi:hypothetical protein
MTDSRNLLLDTDYPLDKIIYMTSGSFSAAGGGGLDTVYEITHNLGFTPLVIGTWSTDIGFSTSREGGFFAFEGTDPNTIYTQFFANSTKITVTTSNPTASSVTIYYRIYAFTPSDVNLDASFTTSVADIFALNTDYNYTKLYSSGIATAAAITTITHGLGYRPQVMAWIKDGSAAYGTSMVVDMGYVKATATTVVITSPNKDIHYRIYADGQV